MSNWFPFHYRDVKAWHNENLPLTGTSDEGAKFLDAAVAQMVLMDTDPGAENALEKATQADPNLFMAKLVSVALEVMGGSNTLKNPKIAEKVNHLRQMAEQQNVSQWERNHMKAVEALAINDLVKACLVWEDILVEHPKDILAMHWQFFLHMTTGRNRFLRDDVRRVLKHYKPSDRYYGNVHGKMCFGYEENQQYEKAMKESDIALSCTPQDVWAIHSTAHIYEETARPAEGVSFLDKMDPYWSNNATFPVHVWWHKSLFMVSMGEFDAALNLFDQQVKVKAVKSGFPFPLSDATSLLLRLEMENKKNNQNGVWLYKDRWRELGESFKTLGSINNVFYDYHNLVASALSGNRLAAEKLRDEIAEQASLLPNNKSFNCMVADRVGVAVANAALAFTDHDYDSVVNLLTPLRFEVQELLGGSHAQKDVIDLMLIRSAIWAGRANLADQLLSERIARCPVLEEKPLGVNERLNQKIMELH